MSIDAYNAVSQIYQTNKTSTVNRSKSVKDTSDKIEISETARTYQTAKSAVDKASDIREDKVAHIKAMMAAGTYNISASQIVDKLMNDKSTFTF